MRTAISYERVSSDKQATGGKSLTTQRSLIRSYCTYHKLSLLGSYQDISSGTSTRKRQGLEDALQHVLGCNGVLVCYSLNRLGRSVRDLCNIFERVKKGGGDLAFVDMECNTSTPQGKLLFNIFACIAEFESEQIGERIKVANTATVERLGYRTQGNQPAGWKILNGQRVRVPEEEEIIDRVVRAVETTRTYQAAADKLNGLGVPTIAMSRGHSKRDTPNWFPASVRKIEKDAIKALTSPPERLPQSNGHL